MARREILPDEYVLTFRYSPSDFEARGIDGQLQCVLEPRFGHTHETFCGLGETLQEAFDDARKAMRTYLIYQQDGALLQREPRDAERRSVRPPYNHTRGDSPETPCDICAAWRDE